MQQFKGFKPQAVTKIAQAMGYTGDMSQLETGDSTDFEKFIGEDPIRRQQMENYTEIAKQMARGGVVRMQKGGTTNDTTNVTTVGQTLPQVPIPQQNFEEGDDITDITSKMLQTPALPTGAAVAAQGIGQDPKQLIEKGTGEVSGDVDVTTKTADTVKADTPVVTDANLVTAKTVEADVKDVIDTVEAAQADPDDARLKIKAAEQTKSSVSDLNAAQGDAILMENPIQREIQDGELISGAANAEKAAKFTEQIDAATATPTEKATVQGQLASLTSDFDATNPPSWAAGALRGVQAIMAQRGMGASSIAGQAMVQAALESALPIAQADAATQASFEAQNLSNRQARAMLAAQQRATFIGQEFDQAFQARVQNAAKIADVANMNFTAEQQIALENSRIANTMNLANLNNNQAMVMAEASALANLDMANLSNRQQAAVQNAQNFLQVDMANLSNRQQTELFTAQQRIQSLFTDQAAENAAEQFNATSQNQTDQFFANLGSQVSQFNAAQSNAQNQFNAGQTNAVEKFNAELNNQRDQFNAQNQMIIAQSNAQWRRQIATADTAAVNRANEINATAALAISNQAYNNLWQYYGDSMEWAWRSAESSLDRISALAVAELDAKSRKEIAQEEASGAAGSAIGSLIGTLGSAWILSCWVAREVYGKNNIEWFIFRTWLQYDSPKWFKKLYIKHGESYAKFIKHKPMLKWVTKKAMDYIIKSKRRKNNVKFV
tara:strand:- start:13 stop:2184 length:2172 start_codon:yes stop_codon:yes gene_type:complete